MRLCEICGVRVPPDAPPGHCPNCLLELGCRPPPAAPPRPGAACFGDYELLEPIGRGGMGVVHKARQLSLKRLVALKMLNPHAAAFPAVAERIRVEAETAASLHHPHIVTIYEVGDYAGQPFFSMELIEGAGMDKFIGPGGFCFCSDNPASKDKGRRRQVTVTLVMVKIARAVDYAHKRGVLHRDLKPANVLIDTAGEPHLTDFGLAKVLGREHGRSTGTGSVLGTPAYMAPEQAAGETKRVSTASDIYSLGAVLYEMLTGRPPFRADTPLETLRQVTELEPTPLTTVNVEVDRDLATVCLKCLEKDPRRRYSSAQALAEDLERWLREEPIEARPVGDLERLWRWCRREPRLAGMVAGFFLLLVTIAALALTLYNGEKDRRAKTEQEKARQLEALFNRIEKEWNQEDRTGVRIYSQELALLSDRPFVLEGTEVPVVLGIHSRRRLSDPLRMVQRFAPVINFLQTNLVSPGHEPALFELHAYTSHSNAMDALRNRQVDLMQLSPVSYVLMRQNDPTIAPLVEQAVSGYPGLRGAIFTRADTGITRLEDLKGKSFGFGDPDSAITCQLPKVEFLAAGLRARDFRCVTNLSSATVISAVAAGRFDAGAADWDELSRLTNLRVGLRILKEVHSPNYLWVAGKKLDHAIAAAIQERLLSLHDTNVLAAIDHQLIGFRPAQAGNYDTLEKEISKATAFDER